MKRYFILLLILMFAFMGAVKALSIDDFFDKLGTCASNASDPLKKDCQDGEMTISYTIDISANTISYETKYSDINTAIGSSDLFKYLTNGASQELREQYESVRSSDKRVDFSEHMCDLDLVGYCFSSDGEVNTLTAKIDEKFIKYLIAVHSGVPVEELQKEVVETPGTEVPIEQPVTTTTTTEDGKNPDTGSFAEYGFIALLLGALLFVIHLKRRSEVEFRI